MHQKTDSDLVLWGFVKCIFLVSLVLLPIPTFWPIRQHWRVQKPTAVLWECLLSSIRYVIYSSSLCLWIVTVFYLFKPICHLAKKWKPNALQNEYFPIDYTPIVFSACLSDIIGCIFENTRECRSCRLDIFFYSLWVLHTAIDPTVLHERQLQKRKVLIYLTYLKGVPKDYTCCVYSCFSKKRNCFCIERLSCFCHCANSGKTLECSDVPWLHSFSVWY